MNPNVNEKRGCFIRKEENGKFTVVDYPTWTFNKYGADAVPHQNAPVPAGSEFEKTFDTYDEAKAFCDSDNYVVCSVPGAKIQPTPAVYDEYDEVEE